MGVDKRENVIKGLEHEISRANIPTCGTDFIDCVDVALLRDALALLKAQEAVKQNQEQYQCNKCKSYEGVHNAKGHAPCSFWGNGVMWNDYCSRFSPFAEGR